MMTVDQNWTLEEFTSKFLRCRFPFWFHIPRVNAITDFGEIISFVLLREGHFQVELFICQYAPSSFANHRHPDVDTYEYPLTGDDALFKNGQPVHSMYETELWLHNAVQGVPIHIGPDDWHSVIGQTPFAFLSIQKWLNGVQPSSVGLNWEGELSRTVHLDIMNTMAMTVAGRE